jgi:hypothetical protein
MNTKRSQDFQKFDEVAGKLFQVPIEEVRDLEQKKEVKRGDKKSSPKKPKS